MLKTQNKADLIKPDSKSLKLKILEKLKLNAIGKRKLNQPVAANFSTSATINVLKKPEHKKVIWLIVAGKSVIELGAGMTALAGLIVAAECHPERIVLTDGNEKAVENIGVIIENNPFYLQV